MRRLAVIGLFVIAVGSLSPAPLAQVSNSAKPATAAAPGQTVIGGAVARPGEAGITGTALTAGGEPASNMVIRARNLLTNQIDGSARTSDIGDYALLGLMPGNYVLEIVSCDEAERTANPETAATSGYTVAGSSTVQAGATGISGTLRTPGGEPIRNTVVRVRNGVTNTIDGATRTGGNGEYAVAGLRPGSYVLEIPEEDCAGGAIVGTSAFVAATAGAMVSSVAVTATTGLLSAAGTTTGVVAALGATAARGVAAAAGMAGVAAITPIAPTASPSR